MNCPQCNSEVAPDSSFCPQCGAALLDNSRGAPAAGPSEVDPNAPPKDRFLATAAQKQAGDHDDAEDDLWQGSYARLAMLGSWATGGLVTIGAPLFAAVVGLPQGFSKWLILGLALMWAVLLSVYAYRRLSVHYLLTSQRLIHERGLLWRQTDRVELIDIDDVTFRQDPVQRIIGVGTIIISSSDRTDPELHLRGIKRAREVADTIDDARRRERRRRGLHIESV